MKSLDSINAAGGRLIWWAKPHMMCLWHLLPILLLCTYFGDQLAADRGVQSQLDTPRFWALVGAIFTFALGAILATRIIKPVPSARTIPSLWLDVLFWTSTVAFVIWFYALLTNPGLFLSLLLKTEGSVYQIREDYSTIPGVTTLVQAGVAYVCVVAFKYPGLRNLPRRFRIQIGLLLMMAVFRTLAWSERLSLIELSIPLMLAYAVRFDGKPFTRLSRLAPAAGFIGLFLLFGATEYFRSWTNTYQDKYNSLAEFVLLRVSEYYYFAINNGLGILEAEPSSFPHYSMLWLIKFPVLGTLIADGFGVTSFRGDYLESLGLLELNNFGGILALVADYGVILGGLLTALLGYAIGRGALGFAVRGSLLGLIFPIGFLAILDLPRIFYLGDSRAFIPIMLLSIVWLSRR